MKWTLQTLVFSCFGVILYSGRGGGQLTCPGQEQHSETTSKDGVCNLSMMDQNQSYLLINHSMRAPPFVHRVEICQKFT